MPQKQILDHLEQLVAIHPQTEDQAAVLEALNYVKTILDNTGGFQDVKIHNNSGFYSLTASTRGTKKPHMLLQGHIDVVPACTTAQEKLYVNGDTLAGRGVYDMLFAAACYLTFVEQHAAELADLNLGVMLTGDEEIGGFQGTEYLLAQGYGGTVCFLPDAGDGFGSLSISAKGVYNFDLVVHGKAHHGSRPWEGDGAANKLVTALSELMTNFDTSDHHNSTLTVTGLQCGHATNQGPAEATAHLDIRYKDAADFIRIQKAVTQLCQDYQAEIRQIISCDNIAINPDNTFIKSFLPLYEEYVGRPIQLTHAHGGSDARFFTTQNIPVIMLRPDGDGAHGAQEILSLSSLEKFYSLLEEYIISSAKVPS